MRAIVLACSLVSVTAVWADKYTPLNIKTGQWETTMTTSQSGAPFIPPAFAAKMSPDQIAKFQQAMQARAAAGPRTTRPHHGCLIQEDLQKGPTFGQGRGCSRNIVSSTSKKAVVRVTCDSNGMHDVYDVTITANSSESVTGKMHLKSSAGGQSGMADTTFNAKWIGSTCTKKD